MLATGDGSRETARLTLDYLPGHSEEEGGLGADPRGRPLRLRALGYARP